MARSQRNMIFLSTRVHKPNPVTHGADQKGNMYKPCPKSRSIAVLCSADGMFISFEPASRSQQGEPKGLPS